VVKINRLEVENIKRVQAVRLEPSATGLTVIGGRNGQGKTSVLDALTWALGGGKHKPSNHKREGSAAEPNIRVELDNGIVVTRDGKNASLKVIDNAGNKAGQALLDELIGQLALDLPKFMQATSREKAETLLKIIGVGEQLHKLDAEAERIYNERHANGQILLRKKKHAEDLPFEQGVPDDETSAGELIKQQQEILARNGENQRLRANRDSLLRQVEDSQSKVVELRNQLEAAEERLRANQKQFAIASKTAESLVDESTAELETSLAKIDDTNRRVRINRVKRQAEAEAETLNEQVEQLSEQLESVRRQRMQLLADANLPLPELSIEDGELTYRDQRWDCMSGSDQLRVGVAIVRQVRPDCQFVLLDKTEQMDLQTLLEFGEWLESQGLQVIATRVSTGEECSIIIEDGMPVGSLPAAVAPSQSSFDTEGF
jgi:DNA repair exonuclease SbcCD ATPase subunit